jgi:hypothetical protein
MVAMTRGIYISQKKSRSLGVAPGANHPDLLFDERNQPEHAMSGTDPLQPPWLERSLMNAVLHCQ